VTVAAIEMTNSPQQGADVDAVQLESSTDDNPPVDVQGLTVLLSNENTLQAKMLICPLYRGIKHASAVAY